MTTAHALTVPNKLVKDPSGFEIDCALEASSSANVNLAEQNKDDQEDNIDVQEGNNNQEDD